MCIIQGVIKDVSNTRIMAAPFERDNKRYQLTVYENHVQFGGITKIDVIKPANSSSGSWLSWLTHADSSSTNTSTLTNGGAMILPFPNGETCRLVDLSNYSTLFTDLDTVMTEPMMQARGMSLNLFCDSESAEKLEVKQVGSYKVSVATSLEQLANLDFELFQLDPTIRDILVGNYPSHFGFIVCMMDKNAKFHPIGYVHQIKKKLFIPTYHYHDHGNGGMMPARLDGTHEVMVTTSNPDEAHVDWDHEIYIFNVNRDAVNAMATNGGDGVGLKLADGRCMDRLASKVKWDLLEDLKLSDCGDLVKLSINSIFGENIDLIFPVEV